MRAQAGLALFSVLRGAAALHDLPAAPLRRGGDIFGMVKSDVLKRSTEDATFPLDLGVTNQTLFDGDSGDVKLTVTCVECRTTGEVIASAMLPDLTDIDITDVANLFDDAMLGLTFNGVGAVVDIDIAAEASGEFSVPLLAPPTPIGIAGPGFQLGVVFGLDLVLTVTGGVETGGGFKVAIPDGSSFMIPFDDTKSNIANFDGASASLLPITVDVPAEITAALRLKVEAGVMLPDLDVLELTAVAGAFVSIPEVILSGAASVLPSDPAGCVIPASAELNINAGVFVDVGADLAGIDLVDFNPEATTTLFAASTSVCLQSADAAATGTGVAIGTGVAVGTGGTIGTAPVAHTYFNPGAHSWVMPTPTPWSGAYYPAISTSTSTSAHPQPTTLATMRKSAPKSHGPAHVPGPDDEAPVSLAVIGRARAEVDDDAYPIKLQSLATPITKFSPAGPTAAVVVALPRPTFS